MSKRKLELGKVMVAQVRFYETLHTITDERGEQIFVGSEEMAGRVKRLLERDERRRAKMSRLRKGARR